MDIDTKIELVKRDPTEEIVTLQELKELLETNEHPNHYIGFEISGPLHLGTLMIPGHKVNDLSKAGIKTKIFLADWHSYINNKLGGSWERIMAATEYYREAFKFFCPEAEVILGSDFYRGNDEYWRNFVKVSKQVTLARITRCLTIMGRERGEKLDFSQYLYPAMQATDIKYLGSDITHGGMDQRKIHIVAREIFPKLGWKKPVAIHHHLLMGLSPPARGLSGLDARVKSKMSKSKPWTAIFIHDSNEEIRRKLERAWCPERHDEMNPVLEIVRYVIFRESDSFTIERPAKYGGSEEFGSYESLQRAYTEGRIHPLDLKNSVATELDRIVGPVRRHFEVGFRKKLLTVFERED